jgi:sterol desaturase/sphingolipid hydroxylase (fatty acid hydroxylase superfamily)
MSSWALPRFFPGTWRLGSWMSSSLSNCKSHHHEDQYSVWLTTHTHALEVVISATIIATTVCLLGFSEPAIEIYLVFYSFAKVSQHSAHHYRLGLLDFFVISPDYHRIHHHRDSQWNYGISLTIFDILFRIAKWPSLERQDEELRFGLSGEDGYPFGFWEEIAYFVKRQRFGGIRFWPR